MGTRPGRARDLTQRRRCRLGAATLALVALTAPGDANGRGDQLATLWNQARDGFEDELLSGKLAEHDLAGLITRLEPLMEEYLLAARLVFEAAFAIGDEDTAGRATQACTAHVQSALTAARSLRDGGQRIAARELLENTLRLLPSGHRARPFLFHPLATDAAVSEDWVRALDLVDQGLAAMPARFASYRVDLLRVRAATFIGMGLPDLAVEPLQAAQRESEREGSSVDLATRLAVTRLRADQWLATDRLDTLVRELEDVVESLGPPANLTALERGERSKLLFRLGLAQLELAALRPELVDDAVHWLSEAREESVDSIDRFNCESRLAWAALVRDRTDSAADWLERARARADHSDLTSYQRGLLAALEARLAVARGAEVEELRRCFEDLNDALTAMMASWVSAAPLPGGLAFLRYSSRRLTVETLIELAMLLDPDGGELEALRLLYLVRSSGSLVRRLSSDVPEFDEAREALLPEGSGALVYFVGRDRSHVFALEGGRVLHKELPGEWPLRGRVRALDQVLIRDPSELDDDARASHRAAVDQRSSALADALLPPSIRERVRGWDQVTIVGSDLLGEPDFECLPLGDSLLGLSKPLTYLSSLPLGAVLTARREVPRTREASTVHLIARVPVATRPGLPALPLSMEEASDLVRPFEGRAHLLLGDEATHERIAGVTGGNGALVILTHGLRDASLERPSQILIAPTGGDDALSCGDVESLDVPAGVFLGVCGSARGPAREGAGPVSHLGGAFLLAGADSVVLSDAELAYGPTLTMAGVYLEAVSAGEPPAEAMRLARVAVVEQGWPDPFDHALMRVIGLGHKPLATPRGR